MRLPLARIPLPPEALGELPREVLPEVREMPLNDYVAWTDPIAANPAAHPQLGAAGITEEGGEVTYAEREEGAEEGGGGDYVASDAEGG